MRRTTGKRTAGTVLHAETATTGRIGIILCEGMKIPETDDQMAGSQTGADQRTEGTAVPIPGREEGEM